MKFVFPEPGALEGVKSRSKVILRMNNVSFTYPTKDKASEMVKHGETWPFWARNGLEIVMCGSF